MFYVRVQVQSLVPGYEAKAAFSRLQRTGMHSFPLYPFNPLYLQYHLTNSRINFPIRCEYVIFIKSIKYLS